MRESRRENRAIMLLLWDILEKVDPTNRGVYYKGTNGLLRRMLNYIDATSPQWRDDFPFFKPLPKSGFKEVNGPSILAPLPR
jgi:hypothetical protein